MKISDLKIDSEIFVIEGTQILVENVAELHVDNLKTGNGFCYLKENGKNPILHYGNQERFKVTKGECEFLAFLNKQDALLELVDKLTILNS